MVARPAAGNRIDHLADKVQAMQVDMHHLVKSVDKLVVVAEKQAELANELARHSESIDRAFKHVDGVESKLAAAIDRLSQAFKEDRVRAEEIAATVAQHKGGLRALMMVSGAVTALLFIIGGMFASSITGEQSRMELATAALTAMIEREKLAYNLRIDTLSEQVQEVRLERQRDREREMANK